MTHPEIEDREIVESYLQGKLSDVESQAFEEHYFVCEECFAEVREAGNFIAGVRQAAKAGLLPEARRWQPAYVLAWAAAVVLIVTTAWVAFFELPTGRREIARQRVLIEAERSRRQALEGQLAMVRPPAAEGNLPLAMLEASRASQANVVTMPPGAGQLILWIELHPEVRFSSYRLQIRSQSGDTIETVDGLRKNAQGALTASVPAARLPAATYTVLLHGADGVLVGEYRLVVHR